MGKYINEVTLLGNLGKDPEVKAIPNGAKVANFSMATTESYKDKNEQLVEKTEWHNIVAWRGLAEIIEKFVKKGSRILIRGKLQTRSWEDQNGQKRYMTEIVATDLTLLGDPKGSSGGGQAAGPRTAAPQTEDDLPF